MARQTSRQTSRRSSDKPSKASTGAKYTGTKASAITGLSSKASGFGKKVKPDFVYQSNTNNVWMDVDEFRRTLAAIQVT